MGAIRTEWMRANRGLFLYAEWWSLVRHLRTGHIRTQVHLALLSGFNHSCRWLLMFMAQ